MRGSKVQSSKFKVQSPRPERRPGLVLVAGVVLGVALGCGVTGCAGVPTRVERMVYDVRTNEVPVVVVRTNVVSVTNEVPVVVLMTNGVTVTNVVPVVAWATNVVSVTNTVYREELVPRATVEATVASAGEVGGGFLGIGSLLSTALVGLYHLYASLRNRKVNAALVQGVETARAVLLNTPQGQALDAKFVSWLVKQQGAGAVLNDVSALVKRYADATRAEADAAQLAK